MKAFWDFYENMNEIVYAADMDTYELVYMNKRARKVYNIPDRESINGKICYELLQGCSVPCAMCSNSKLKPGEFYEWKYHNSMLGRTFALKDSMIIKDGRRYRMELSIDVTVQEQQRQTIKDFASNEALVNEALRVALSAQTPERSLEVLLQYLGQSLKSDRVYIFEKTPDNTFNNTYEWCAEFVSPEKDHLQNVPYETVAIWHKSFLNSQNVLIKNLEDIRITDPLAYEYLAPQNIRSLVVSPLIFNKEIIGFYGLDNPPLEFLNHISTMCQILGQFIVSILKRRDLVKRLESLSYYDQLTGAMNRHGMNEFIANVPHDRSIGLVYCDVMGLKRLNDAKGHLEGDALLMRTYQCLAKHFPKNTIFRIGGDEFLVMCSDIPEEILRCATEELRADMPNFDLMLAIGFVWRPQCNGQIAELLKEADHLMYEDKRRYYELSPNDRRTK